MPNPTLSSGYRLLRNIHFIKNGTVKEPQKWTRSIPADLYVLDMEDSVPKTKKAEFRYVLERIIPQIDPAVPLAVRINPIHHSDAEWIKDVQCLMHENVNAIVLAKVEHETELTELSTLVNIVEKSKRLRQHHTKFLTNIETAKSLGRVFRIGAAAAGRNIALLFGSYDMAAELHAQVDSHTLQAASEQMLMAARASGLMPIYGPSCDMDSHGKFEAACRRAFNAGFVGGITLTKRQAILAQKAFQPSRQQRADFEQILNLSDQGIKLYQRSERESRLMIGPPHVTAASKVARLCSEITQSSEDNFEKLLPKFPRSLATTSKYELSKVYRCPFPVTIDRSTGTVWNQWFLNCQPQCESRLAAAALNFSSVQVPFGLLMNIALASAVIKFSDRAKVHLGIYDAVQRVPVSYGDTLQTEFSITSLQMKNSANNEVDIVDSRHRLVNETNNEIVFEVSKRTMFPKGLFPNIPPAAGNLENVTNALKQTNSLAHSFIDLQKVDKVKLTNSGFFANQPLKVGDVYVHRFVKLFGDSDTHSLFNFLHVINDHHVNVFRFKPEDILVSGPTVVTATLANFSNDFGTIIQEEIPEFISVNKVNKGDMISTISYIESVEKLGFGFEKVSVKVIGVKNLDPGELASITFPNELFGKLKRPREYEDLCSKKCITLYNRIVCIGTRIFTRIVPSDI